MTAAEFEWTWEKLTDTLKVQEADIKRLEAVLQPFANCGHYILGHGLTKPDLGIWLPRTTADPQPPGILVKHLLDAAKVLPDGSDSTPPGEKP